MEKHESAKLGTINARDEVINMNFHHCPVNIKKYIDRRLKHPIFLILKFVKQENITNIILPCPSTGTSLFAIWLVYRDFIIVLLFLKSHRAGLVLGLLLWKRLFGEDIIYLGMKIFKTPTWFDYPLDYLPYSNHSISSTIVLYALHPLFGFMVTGWPIAILWLFYGFFP